MDKVDWLVVRCDKSFLDGVWGREGPDFFALLKKTIESENRVQIKKVDKLGCEFWIGCRTVEECELAWKPLQFWTDECWEHKVLHCVYIIDRKQKKTVLWETEPGTERESPDTCPQAESPYMIDKNAPMDAAKFDEWCAGTRYNPLQICPMIMTLEEAEKLEEETQHFGGQNQ